MKKRFLGIICLLYSGLFIYVLLFNKLKFFLAPQNQIYLKISIVPMIIIGLVLLFNNDTSHKFKISDLILILPIILLIISGDCRLTVSFASNRTGNFNKEKRVKSEINTNNQETDDNSKIVEKEKNYDFSNPYFDIIDENYDKLSTYITFKPKADKFAGQTIRVRGFALNKSDYLSNDYFAIGKYSISCCAADAGFVGFIVKRNNVNIKENSWYEIEGVLEKGKDSDGYQIMFINIINIKQINAQDEEQYVYPCYSYKNNACESLMKYDLEY